MSRTSPSAAARELAGRDEVFAAMVARHGSPRFGRRPRVDERFEAIARSIAYQQLAGAAAGTIWRRTLDLAPGPLEPVVVLDLGVEKLRSAGLSRSKAASLVDLAAHVDDERLDLGGLGRRSDDEVIEALTAVRGIGPWTAQMFLMFGLRRPDVWPVGDLGVRAGYGIAHGLASVPTPRQLESAGERLRPYRSVGAWYCWREVEASRR